jgi:spore maturation protein CgeB
VGDSLAAATVKFLNLSGLGPEFLPEIDLLAQKFLNVPDLLPENLAKNLSQRERLDQDRTRALWALITWRASRLKRAQIVQAVARPGFSLYGDLGWREIAPFTPINGPVNYYEGLASLYRSTAVNLNVTSAQMKTGLNQRVFDAPMAGGFLLTDSKTQLFDLFAKDEVAVYETPFEAKRALTSWLKRPADRKALLERARARILGEHLYSHRLQKIFKRVFSWGG